ncbi:hypothetical protein [Frankia sp. CiP3]|uniref:hypothetical protein n=1 Tax=Frankia sp. CiP3 TaxID=2880971 RepID=UPI001EF4CAA9|nr:hypothetical protein [Frankia sp. CiP3]
MGFFGGKGRDHEHDGEQQSLAVLRNQRRIIQQQVDEYDRQLTEARDQGDEPTVQAIEQLIRPLRDQLAGCQAELDRRAVSASSPSASSESGADSTVADLTKEVRDLKRQARTLTDEVNGLARRLVEQGRALDEQDKTIDGLKKVIGRQDGAAARRDLAGLRTYVEQQVAALGAHLVGAQGIATDGGVYAALARETSPLRHRIGQLEDGQKTLIAHILDLARQEAEQLAKAEVELVRTGLAELDASWANLRAERVRADSSQVRATDAVHTALAAELASLAKQRARNLALGVNPADPGADLAQFRAWVVRNVLIGCFAGPMVNEDQVRVALYGSPEHGSADADQAAGLRRFVDAAKKLRAKIAAAERQADFDFDLPTEGASISQYDVWPPSVDDAAPDFVVVPAYRVAGHTFGLPVVFTRSPATGPAQTPAGHDGRAS